MSPSPKKTVARRLWLALCLLLLVWCSDSLLNAEPLWAQTGAADATSEQGSQDPGTQGPGPLGTDPEEGASSESEDDEEPLSRTTLRLTSDRQLFSAWVELTPLRAESKVSAAPPATLHWLGDLTVEAADDDARTSANPVEPDLPMTLDPAVPQGPTMVCFGSRGVGVQCAKQFIYRPEDRGFDALSEALATPLGREPLGSADLTTSADPLTSDVSTTDPTSRGLSLPLAIELSAAAGTSIVGRVVEDGFGLAGVRVALAPAGLESARGFTLPLRVDQIGAVKASRFGVTDNDGKFNLPPVAAGRYLLELSLPSGLTHRTAAFEVPEAEQSPIEGPRNAAVLDLGEIVPPVGLEFEVLTLDSQGQAIVGARVEATQAEENSGDRRQAVALSDQQGRVRLSGLLARPEIELRCSAAGHESVDLRLELLPVSIECVLPALARVIGTVDLLGESANGAPAAGEPADGEPGSGDDSRAADPMALVWISAKPGDRPEATYSAATVPDDRGRFELTDLAAGPWQLTVVAPGYQPEVQSVQPVAGETVDLAAITLTPAVAIEGRVVSAGGERPIPGATVEVLDPLGAGSTLTDSRGRFQVSSAGDRPLTLRVYAEDRPARQVTWSPAQQRADGDKIVELSRGGWIRALVAGDRPCIGCELRLVAQQATAEVSGPPATMETDAGGEALSQALAPGGYYVVRPRFESRGTWVREVADAEQRFVRVQADEISTVRFEAGEELRLRAVPLDRLAGGSLQLRSPVGRQRGVDEGGGVFRFQPHPDEVHEVYLERPNAAGSFDDLIYLGPLPTGSRQISVLSGVGSRGNREELRAVTEVRMLGGGLHGRLETWQRQGIAGARIRLRSLEDHRFRVESQSHDDGSFRIEDVHPGVYALFIGERAYQFVSVQAGQMVDLGVFQPTAGSY